MNKSISSHVPPELVRDFSVVTDPRMEPVAGGCPYKALAQMLDGKPRAFYAPEPGHRRPGNWVVSRAEDIRAVVQNADVYSSKGKAAFSALLGETWDLLPLEVDGAIHAKYRALLEPELTPKKVDALIPAMEAFADGLLARIKDGKECEFVQSLAQRYPVMVFLKLMGLPADQLETFAAWAWSLLHGKDQTERIDAAHAINDYLVQAMKDAAALPADNTLVSKIVHGQIDGRALTDDEKIGYAYLLFVGGLDTVASSLGYYFRHLADDQALQKQLREHPESIPAAIEEFLRLYGNVTTNRLAIQDNELAGVQIKAGDYVSFSYVTGSRDPLEVPNPDVFRLDRGNKPHLSFGAGKHRCMGSHVARVEMAIFMRKFLETIPQFRIKPGTQPLVHGGGVFGIKEMHLSWD